MKKVGVIGAGFSSLSAACYLAKAGFDVTILEKNDTLGGRARKRIIDGFTFDLGPSWYWMPDVFEKFYNDFGKQSSDFYELMRLSPSYKVFFEDNEQLAIPANLQEFYKMFEEIEPGSSVQLDKFLKEAKYKYEVGINDMVQKPGLSVLEFAQPKLLYDAFRLHIFQSFSKYIRKYFNNPKLLQLMEFPVLFLGALPQNTPALYSLMNYADIALGTWYPMGGMSKIVDAFVTIAGELGVDIRTDHEVLSFNTKDKSIQSVVTSQGILDFDIIVGGADYHHLDQHILANEFRGYSEKYWSKRKLAPSAIIFYLGFDIKIPNIEHHNLFFDEDFTLHGQEIYETHQWPKAPLLYVSATSKSDDSVAPEGCENIMILIPVSTELTDSEAIRQRYLDFAMQKLECYSGIPLTEHLVTQSSYAHSDFKKDYHSFKGNAYGLANTLDQTAILKPKMKSKKVKNLYFTGQLTVPGPGVPPSIISGEVVSRVIVQNEGI